MAGWRRVSWPVGVLAALVAVAVGLRIVAALALPSPWLFPDEGAYALLGRGLWRHGDLAVLGGPSEYVSALYPVVSALPHAVLQVLQVLALCGTAVVAYVWTRSLARPAWALLAAALTLALPGLVYAGAIVAEALFVPLAALASWLAIRALESPSRRNQVALVAALLACTLTRGEANLLLLAVLVAAARARRVRALSPTWLAAAAFTVAWLALGGGSPLRSLGGSGAGSYSAHRVVVWVLQLGGDLLLVCGAVPLCAAILLAWDRTADVRTRATADFAVALAALAVLELGAFTAGHADRLLERELLFTLPPLLVAFSAWLGRGAGRPKLRTAAVAVAATAALLAMPFGRLAQAGSAGDNPTLVPLTHLDSPQVYGVVALFALAAGALLFALPARRIWLLPGALIVLFAATSVSAADEFADRARAARQTDVAPAANWVDRSSEGAVTFVYDGAAESGLVWSQLFWNDRIATVLDLPAAHVPGPLPQGQLQIFRDDGALRLVGGGVPAATALVAPQGLRFRGTLVSHAARLGLSLWRVTSPPRLRTWLQGVQPNGDLLQGGVATLDVFDCGRGTMHLVAVGRDNESLRLSRDGTPVVTTKLWPNGVWEQSIRTHATATTHRCSFSLSTTSLVHLAAFAWTPG